MPSPAKDNLFIYNSLTGEKEAFTPDNPDNVTMYVCGPTVYSSPHIGNARPAVVFDLLYRVLKAQYQNVTYARNITDIDDKINIAAKERNINISEITNAAIEVYHNDVAALGCLSPDIEPRATAHIPDIINMIERLIASGNAYEAEGHVLFNVPSYGEYGKLSRRNRDDMIAGARVEVAPYKKDPADFILWKPSSADLPGWGSPWGRGRPGWHIECSSMIETHLGNTIDIHGGGQDLIFPHHENEIAQGTCAHDGAPYCRYWVHNGFVNVNREKMSKSQGNILLVSDLLAQAPGEVIRLALLSTHYHQPLDWTDDTITQAKQVLDKFYRILDGFEEQKNSELPAGFLEALNDDLNTPKALSILHSLARGANKTADLEAQNALKQKLLNAGRFMGILQSTTEEWFNNDTESIDHAEIEDLIKQREEARKNKDFALSDKIRDDLAARGITLEDSSTGTKWRVG